MQIKQFKDWGIFSKVLSLAVTSVISIVMLFFFVILPSMEDAMFNDKAAENKHLVETAHSIVNYYYNQFEAGAVSEDEAKHLAMEHIKPLRFDESNYYWINDLEPRMLMHPANEKLNGQDLSTYKDPNGKLIFVEMAKICKNEGSGFVEYSWEKPGYTDPVPKISFVKLFAPWGWIVGSGMYIDNIENTISASRNEVLVYVFLIVVILGVLGFFIASRISKPVRGLVEISNRLAVGDISVRVEQQSKDEIGVLEKSFSDMIENIKQQAQHVEQLADGNSHLEVHAKSENDVLSKSIIKIREAIDNLIKETVKLTEGAVEGDLSFRGNAGQFKGGYKSIVEGFNKTLDTIISPIKDGTEILATMAQGDLTIRVTRDYKRDHQILKNSINTVGESLESTIINVSEAVIATSSSAAEISSSTEQMAAGAQEQAAQTGEIASAVEQMTSTIIQTTQNATSAAKSSKHAGEIAHEGGNVISETVGGMNKIAEVVSNATAIVRKLGVNSDQIGGIIQVIDDIADQTNLLALNAAIEAARAGEQGRGFAVVADEVRKLAERTTKATKEIAVMIKQMQNDTTNAVGSIEQGAREVETGKNLAKKAIESLHEIIKAANDTSDIVSQVAAASEEQSSAAEQISKSIEGISSVTHENAAGTQQIARASEDLSRLTENLQKLINRFKVSQQLDTNHANSNESIFAIRENGKIVHS